MEEKFLEVLQGLCSTVTVSLQTALQYQKDTLALADGDRQGRVQTLSDRLARVLDNTRLTMVGTERGLGISQTYLFLQIGEILNQLSCNYCRLTYGHGDVSLEAIVGLSSDDSRGQGQSWGLESEISSPVLEISSREQEIAGLLAVGMRDRDIAQELHISESTVKFHMNKVMAKLNSRTRYQALCQLTAKGWL